MNGQEKLKQQFEELKKSLQENDAFTFKILLQGEKAGTVETFRKMLSQEQTYLKDKFEQYVLKYGEQLNIFSADDDMDKIRKIQNNPNSNINQSVYSSQPEQPLGSLLLFPAKKGKQKMQIQQCFNYPFYGVVKCLMVAYGDPKPEQEAIKMMHSQLEILMEKVSLFLQEAFGFLNHAKETNTKQRKLAEKSTRKKVPKQQNNKKNPNKDKATQQLIKQNLKQIFKQQVTNYQQITKQYKKATKQSRRAPAPETVEGNQSQPEALLSESFSSSSSESESKAEAEVTAMYKNSHMATHNLEETQYFAKLTTDMTEKEYEVYCENRGVNFLYPFPDNSEVTKIKFANFVLGSNFSISPSSNTIHLLSFISCRMVRKIFFKILKLNSQNQILQPPKCSLNAFQICQTGNEIIEHYQQKFKQIIASKKDVRDKAKQCFINDLVYQDFMSLLPRGVIRSASNNKDKIKTGSQMQKDKIQSDMKIAQNIWNECKNYQQMWINRMNGQKQAQKYLLKQTGQFYPETQYGIFIFKHLNFYKTKGRTELWRKYLTQQKIQDQIIDNQNQSKLINPKSTDNQHEKRDQHNKMRQSDNMSQLKQKQEEIGEMAKPRKRVKLQSLKN